VTVGVPNATVSAVPAAQTATPAVSAIVMAIPAFFIISTLEQMTVHRPSLTLTQQ
jgi:hypothetical protein